MSPAIRKVKLFNRLKTKIEVNFIETSVPSEQRKNSFSVTKVSQSSSGK
jgi:hypothetical protein